MSNVSVIIPAYNEAQVITQSLRTMVAGAEPGELEIIVVANGCTDDTANRARAMKHPDIRVIETPIGSKINALNLGDAAATFFPRFYVDADIRMSVGSIRAVAEVLREGRALAAAPRLEVDLSDRNWSIRAFYEIWLRLPYHRKGMIGAGVYAISEAGRQRFHTFPNVIADDGFVHGLFAPTERLMVESHRFVVTPPRTMRGMIKINTRWRLGGYELCQLGMAGSAFKVSPNQWSEAIFDLLRHPSLWPSVFVYLIINIAGRFRAKRQLPKLRQYRWERDNSSRVESTCSEAA